MKLQHDDSLDYVRRLKYIPSGKITDPDYERCLHGLRGNATLCGQIIKGSRWVCQEKSSYRTDDITCPRCRKAFRESTKQHSIKIEPYTPYWEKLANAEARDFCPEIYPCAECGHPVIDGFCCAFCQSSNPRQQGQDNK